VNNKLFYREPNPNPITKEIDCVYTCESLDLSQLDNIIGKDHGIKITIEPMQEENNVCGSDVYLSIVVTRKVTETPDQAKARYQKEIDNNLLFIKQEKDNHRLWEDYTTVQSILNKVINDYPYAMVLHKPYGFVVQSKPHGFFLSIV